MNSQSNCEFDLAGTRVSTDIGSWPLEPGCLTAQVKECPTLEKYRSGQNTIDSVSCNGLDVKIKGSLGLAFPKSGQKLFADVISLIFLRFCCFVLLRRLAIRFQVDLPATKV